MTRRRRTHLSIRDARRGSTRTVLRCESLELRQMLAGTAELVKDILPGADSSLNSEPVLFDGAAYFFADDGVHGREIWRSDGTSEGTRLLKDIAPGPVDNQGSGLTIARGQLVFFAVPGPGQIELWTSDGTEAGTRRAVNLKPLIGESVVFGDLWAAGGQLYFSATRGTFGVNLWRTDGTAEGTSLVRDLGEQQNFLTPSPVGTLGDKLLFIVSPGDLWSIDPAGAQSRIGHVPWITFASAHAVVGEWLYFVAANDDLSGSALFKTNGTTDSRVLVKSLSSDGVVRLGTGMQPLGDGVVLGIVASSLQPAEIWFSDGAEQGTVRLLVGDDSLAAYPVTLQTVGDVTLLRRPESMLADALWKTDGTPAGTTKIASLPGTIEWLSAERSSSDSVSYFTLRVNRRYELWRSDGSNVGTSKLIDVGDYNPWAWTVLPIERGKLLVFPNDGVHGSEPWVWQPLSGDANLDDRVDLTDFSALKATLGKTGQGLPTDFDFDQDVDLDDFAVLKNQFGVRLPPPPLPAPTEDRWAGAIGLAFAQSAEHWWDDHRPGADQADDDEFLA